jgi:hypothetical protein
MDQSEGDLFRILLTSRSHYLFKMRAIGALEIGELDYLDGGVRRACAYAGRERVLPSVQIDCFWLCGRCR